MVVNSAVSQIHISPDFTNKKLNFQQIRGQKYDNSIQYKTDYI